MIHFAAGVTESAAARFSTKCRRNQIPGGLQCGQRAGQCADLVQHDVDLRQHIGIRWKVRFGTANTVMPAASAARRPFVLSSTATHALAGAPSRRAASR
jgi:hypothetical protein